MSATHLEYLVDFGVQRRPQPLRPQAEHVERDAQGALVGLAVQHARHLVCNFLVQHFEVFLVHCQLA